jgi:hypothetical protein
MYFVTPAFKCFFKKICENPFTPSRRILWAKSVFYSALFWEPPLNHYFRRRMIASITVISPAWLNVCVASIFPPGGRKLAASVSA